MHKRTATLVVFVTEFTVIALNDASDVLGMLIAQIANEGKTTRAELGRFLLSDIGNRSAKCQEL